MDLLLNVFRFFGLQWDFWDFLRTFGISLGLFGFLGFLLDSRISKGFLIFLWDLRGFMDCFWILEFFGFLNFLYLLWICFDFSDYVLDLLDFVEFRSDYGDFGDFLKCKLLLKVAYMIWTCLDLLGLFGYFWEGALGF